MTQFDVHQSLAAASTFVAAAQPPPADDGRAQPTDFHKALLSAVLAALRETNFADAATILCKRVQALLGCEAVALAVREGSAGKISLTSVSNADRIDRRSPLVDEIENALREAVLLEQPTANRELGRAVQTGVAKRLGDVWANGRDVLAAPLRSGEGRVAGAWVVAATSEFFGSECSRRQLAEASAAVATCLATLDEKHASPATRVARRVKNFVRSRKGAVAAVALTGALLVGAVPWPYRVSCEGTCEPVSRRFVAAPFDGVLHKAVVAPGDAVEQGAVLGMLDGENLNTELVAANAELKQTRQRYDAALASADAASATIERLKLAQLNARLEMLDHLQDQLTIRSPVAGVVVSGDLARSEGTPVSTGQMLFEVAPLTEMLVEAYIPESEVDYAQQGMTASVWFDAVPGIGFSGVVERVYPRAESHEDQNVFVAVVSVERGRHDLRPGMSATVKLHAGARPLAWIGLHRPFNAARAALGW